jgi:hypothetical protein
VKAPARVAAWLSIASLVGIVPHVMEDVRYGQAQNFHLTTVQFEWFSGVAVLVTAATALSCLSGSRFGAYAVILIGVLWAGLGAADHYRAFVPGDFRAGISSRCWVWLLVGLQAAAGVVMAGAALRLPGRARGSTHTAASRH